jgi:hypothetical protein
MIQQIRISGIFFHLSRNPPQIKNQRLRSHFPISALRTNPKKTFLPRSPRKSSQLQPQCNVLFSAYAREYARLTGTPYVLNLSCMRNTATTSLLLGYEVYGSQNQKKKASRHCIITCKVNADRNTLNTMRLAACFSRCFADRFSAIIRRPGVCVFIAICIHTYNLSIAHMISLTISLGLSFAGIVETSYFHPADLHYEFLLQHL